MPTLVSIVITNESRGFAIPIQLTFLILLYYRRVRLQKMSLINKSHPEEFVLLGFADCPWLELPLFIILLVTYPTAMIGNIAIILVSTLAPAFTAPCTSSSVTSPFCSDLKKNEKIHGAVSFTNSYFIKC